MDSPTLTAVAVTAAVLGLCLYDLWAYRHAGNDATISRVLLRVSARRRLFAMAVVFLLGLLCGHLFLPQILHP